MAEKKKQGGVNHLYKLLYQYEDEGEKAYTLPRVTNEHSTGDMLMDEYLGGGYGRPNAYEIVMIFGDTGCIAGDALIPFKSTRFGGHRGKSISLANLYKRFHGIPYTGCHGDHTDETIWVRAHSGNHLPIWVEVGDVIDKGERPTLRIKAGGNEVVATVDHPFLTEEGWKPLEDIKVGEKVMVARRKALKKDGKNHCRSHVVYTKFHPINHIAQKDKNCFYHVGVEHRLRYEAMKNKMSYDDYIYLLNHYDGRELWVIPKGMEVHHIDGDHSNNALANLTLLSKRDHALAGVSSSISNLDYTDSLCSVESIEPAGVQHVYDISCKKVHNFVANNFVVHNCNKSTFTTQLILNPALKGKQIAIFALEDDVVDVYTRIRRQSLSFGAGKFDDPMVAMRKISKSIWMAPDSDGYTLEAMALEIESLFTTGTDIVVVDPLQFIFEASVVEKTETEFNRQRLFMRQINNMMKRVARETGKSKTIILVSHTNKGRYESAMDNIMGSGANKQVPTKIIQVYRDKDGFKFIRLHKSRFTQHRFGSHPLELDPNTMTFHTIACPPDRSPEDWANEIRACWDRKGA